MFTKSAVIAVATVLTFSSPGWAADNASTPAPSPVPATAPLAPGQAAGVKRAEDTVTDNTLLTIGGLAILGTGIALIVSNNGNHSTLSTSTTSTTGTH
jgi:hypothetical protein